MFYFSNYALKLTYGIVVFENVCLGGNTPWTALEGDRKKLGKA